MEEKIVRLLEKLCGVLLLAMVSLLFVQIATRYIFQGSLLWAGEMAVWLFVWTSLLGSVVLYIRKKHVVIEMLSYFMPKKIRARVNAFMEKLNILIVLCFFIIVFYYSIPVVKSYSNQTATSIAISKFFLFVPLSIASALIVVYSLFLFIRSLRRP